MAIVPVEGRKRSIWTRLIGAAMLALCLSWRSPPASRRWRRTVEPRCAGDSRAIRRCCWRPTRWSTTTTPNGDGGRRRADRIWRQPPGRQRVVYNRKTGAADRQRQCRDRRQQRHQDLFRRDRHHRRFRATASSTRCASRRSTRPISPPKAPSARAAVVTTFNNGVYTACEPCEEKPDQGADLARQGAGRSSGTARPRPCVSRIRASSSSACRSPICRSSKIADPTVKRKTGFLFPGVNYKSELGVGVSVPYYFALSPTYDLTLTGTATIRKQGFLGQAEWRQRFNNGYYSLRSAGIHQQDPGAFRHRHTSIPDRRRPEQIPRHGRHQGPVRASTRAGRSAGTSSSQSDKNFSNTYGIDGYHATTSTVPRST